ncbi:MAG: hypothetical protein K2N94_01110 [Lachnospiraceae bacterium]|nr:hypothetical protein [Lachnospiraceae bacterium]
MNEIDLFFALNDVNDEFILEASLEYRNTEKSDKRISAKWKPCIIAICTAFIFLSLTVWLTEHTQIGNDIQEQMAEGDTMKLYVQREGETTVYISTDGAISWSDERNPGFYMQMTEEKLTDSVVNIPIKIVNVSDNNLTVGSGFSLYVWKDNEWIPSEADGLFHEDMGYCVQSHTSYEMICDLQNIRLKAGKYLIAKTVIRNDDRSVWTLSTEFTVKLGGK